MLENFLSAEGGHGKGFWDADQVLFLNLSRPWQTSLTAIFLTQVPKSCFYKAVPFLKILLWLTSLTQNKIKSSYHGLQGLKHLAPSTFLSTSHPRHMRQAPAAGPFCTLSLQPWKLSVQLSYDYPPPTSFRWLYKCLLFRDACPLLLSSYPFIFLYAT